MKAVKFWNYLIVKPIPLVQSALEKSKAPFSRQQGPGIQISMKLLVFMILSCTQRFVTNIPTKVFFIANYSKFDTLH